MAPCPTTTLTIFSVSAVFFTGLSYSWNEHWNRIGEASKQLADYKFRAQKAEQDVATLQATVARLESQVIRYKTAAEVSEQSEEALKAEKRKLQREVRLLLGHSVGLEAFLLYCRILLIPLAT